jgi:hypothetical protein
MIVACLMLSLTTQAQPPKRASKIIVAPSDTSVLLNRIALALIDKGFEIDRKDSELKTVTTKERSMQKGAAQTKIQAHINDTAVIFTSTLCVQLELNISGTIIKPTFDPVTYSGMKGSYMREAWNELEEIARKFGEKIIFSK